MRKRARGIVVRGEEKLKKKEGMYKRALDALVYKHLGKPLELDPETVLVEVLSISGVEKSKPGYFFAICKDQHGHTDEYKLSYLSVYEQKKPYRKYVPHHFRRS